MIDQEIIASGESYDKGDTEVIMVRYDTLDKLGTTLEMRGLKFDNVLAVVPADIQIEYNEEPYAEGFRRIYHYYVICKKRGGG